jgi:hypothetical protein
MSTVWIVPFLMFFDVTTIVAAVLLAAATIADTTAAMSALFIFNPFPAASPWRLAATSTCPRSGITTRNAHVPKGKGKRAGAVPTPRAAYRRAGPAEKATDEARARA